MSNFYELTREETDLRGERASWNRLGDTNQPRLLFSPANGFTAATYRFFLKRFAHDFSISAVDNRGAWPNQPGPNRFDWSDHAGDLVEFIQSQGGEPITAIGHSLGGAIILQAAAKHPDLFRRVVLIDPAAAVSRWYSVMSLLAPMSFKRRSPLVRSTAARKKRWSSRQEFIASMRTKAAYKGFCDEALADYAEFGLTTDRGGNGFHLAYPAIWEAHNFCYFHYLWDKLPKITVPILFLRAEHTYLYSRRQMAKASWRFPKNVVCKELPGIGHLAPQENPGLVERYIREWLEQVR